MNNLDDLLESGLPQTPVPESILHQKFDPPIHFVGDYLAAYCVTITASDATSVEVYFSPEKKVCDLWYQGYLGMEGFSVPFRKTISLAEFNLSPYREILEREAGYKFKELYGAVEEGFSGIDQPKSGLLKRAYLEALHLITGGKK